jgi:hypothetical protein
LDLSRWRQEYHLRSDPRLPPPANLSIECRFKALSHRTTNKSNRWWRFLKRVGGRAPLDPRSQGSGLVRAGTRLIAKPDF